MVQKTIQESIPFAYRYFEQTNQILGMVGFATAFACLGTDNPVFYAYLALLFIVLAWGDSFCRFKRRLDLLSVASVPEMNKMEILKRCKVGLVGAFVLSAVATGFLDKYGLNLDPNSNRITFRSALALKSDGEAGHQVVQRQASEWAGEAE